MTETDSPFGDQYLSTLMGRAATILINNAWARLGPRDTVILVGLSDKQKSYLLLPANARIIQIASTTDVGTQLASFSTKSSEEMRCKSSDVLRGLAIALKDGKRLVIDEEAQIAPNLADNKSGIVVVEALNADVSPVIAINYARSVDADICVVDALPQYEGRDIQRWIYDWKEKNDDSQFTKLRNTALQRIGSIPFEKYEYATFFTEGLPYSLVIENVIPCSHVNLAIRPDLIVFNNLLYDSAEDHHSAIVFSPTFFQDEETDELCKFFAKNEYYLRAMIGQDASVSNFGFSVQFFPYDILHICSHGGEVDGYEMTDTFVDREGNIHTVEFEEVVGYSPVPDKKGIVEVIRKVFPRKLDGFEWKSAELAKQNIPSHVYTGMWDCILKCKGRRKKKEQVEMSCHIACADSIHQGQFHTLANHGSPLVFNNACWSWSEVAAFFLDCGARGYVGTLWAIDNQDAVLAAEIFYEKLFSDTVLAALHHAIKAIEGTLSKNIYVYWGLHFTKFTPGLDSKASKRRVRKELMLSAVRWVEKIGSTQSAEVKRNSIRVLKSILRELQINFSAADINEFERKIKEKVDLDGTARRNASQASTNVDMMNTRDSVELPRERRDRKKQE
jgi:hypothetical protein